MNYSKPIIILSLLSAPLLYSMGSEHVIIPIEAAGKPNNIAVYNNETSQLIKSPENKNEKNRCLPNTRPCSREDCKEITIGCCVLSACCGGLAVSSLSLGLIFAYGSSPLLVGTWLASTCCWGFAQQYAKNKSYENGYKTEPPHEPGWGVM